MNIRPITPNDLPSVLEVYRQCEGFLSLGPNPTASAEMVATDCELSAAQHGEFCGIFAPDETLLGIMDFVRAGFHGQPDCAFIELLMIAAPFRGQGLGAKAVAWLENELRQAGISHLEAAVQENNHGAIRFWNNQGFAVIGPCKAQPDGTVTFPLEKILGETQ